jgi:hypothetical protein
MVVLLSLGNNSFIFVPMFQALFRSYNLALSRNTTRMYGDEASQAAVRDERACRCSHALTSGRWVSLIQGSKD